MSNGLYSGSRRLHTSAGSEAKYQVRAGERDVVTTTGPGGPRSTISQQQQQQRTAEGRLGPLSVGATAAPDGHSGGGGDGGSHSGVAAFAPQQQEQEQQHRSGGGVANMFSDCLRRVSYALQNIANSFDLRQSTGSFPERIAWPTWFCVTAWGAVRIVLAATSYHSVLRTYELTSRPTYDYREVWELVSLSVLLAVFFAPAVVVLFGAKEVQHVVTAMFIQACISLSTLLYCEQRTFGTINLIAILPMIGALFNASAYIMALGWAVCTVVVVLAILGPVYFPSFLRFLDTSAAASWSASAAWVEAVVYLFASGLILIVPQLYQYWLQRLMYDQDRLVRSTVEVAELLVTMNTDQALKVLDDEEASSVARVGQPLRTATTLRRLTLVLSKYRSFLPNSLLVQQNGVENFEDDDEDVGDGGGGGGSDGHSRTSSGGGDESDDGEYSVTDAGRPPKSSHKTDNTTAPLIDPYLLEESRFRRRWSTVLYVCATQTVTDAAQVQDVADRFCSAVIPSVIGRRGVMDRLGPTSILASFNCHTPCVIHESEAATCALSVAAELSQHADIPFTILIASGYNYVGTCGVDTHRARVVLGESVELVHRLMPLAASTLACRILLTEDTANKIGLETAPIDHVLLNQHGSLFLREKPVALFELRSARKENAPQALASAFSAAFSALRAGDYVTALAMFRNYVDRNPTDFQARRLAALCEPLANEMVLLQQRTMKQSASMLAATGFVIPYVRKELLWEENKAEVEFVKKQRVLEANGSLLAATNHSGSQHFASVDGLGVPKSDLGDTVRQHFQSQRLDYQEDGLVSMFVAVGDDDDAVEPKPDDQYTAHDALSTEVPRTFDDSAKKRWRRSSSCIGEGAFGQIYLALGELGDLVAMKCFNLANQRTQIEELIQELHTLSSLRNDYIVGYVSYAVTPNHLIILMEYVSGGSLLSMLQQFGPLPLAAAKRYLIDILKGLRYLHENHVTHCDIKPHNALLANDGTCKLSDFGSSVNNQVRKPRGDGSPNSMDDQLLVRGTSWYLAPEAAKGEVRPANDIWSLGVTFIEMVTGRQPWTFRGSEAQFIIQLGKDETMKPPLPTDLPDEGIAFLNLCFQRDPAKRPTATKLLCHSFLT